MSSTGFCTGLFCIATASAVVYAPAQPAVRSFSIPPSELHQASSLTATTAIIGKSACGLTLHQAEEQALRKNPRISIAHLESLAQSQRVRESRAGDLPQVTSEVTVARAYSGSRIAASNGLNDSRLFTHAGAQATVSQTITDFGRTKNLIASARLAEKAYRADELATREEVVLITDRAFFAALRAQSLMDVAERDLATRTLTLVRIGKLAANNGHYALDLALANGNVRKAQVQILEANDEVQVAMADLKEVIGVEQELCYNLLDDGTTAEPPSADEAALIQKAIEQREDLRASSLRQESAERYSRAEANRLYPIVSAIGTLGSDPVRPGQYFISSWNGAVG